MYIGCFLEHPQNSVIMGENYPSSFLFRYDNSIASFRYCSSGRNCKKRNYYYCCCCCYCCCLFLFIFFLEEKFYFLFYFFFLQLFDFSCSFYIFHSLMTTTRFIISNNAVYFFLYTGSPFVDVFLY